MLYTIKLPSYNILYAFLESLIYSKLSLEIIGESFYSNVAKYTAFIKESTKATKINKKHA